MLNIRKSRAIHLLLRASFMGCFAVTTIAVLHPDVRTQVRGAFIRDFRTILSTAQGDLLGNGGKMTVVKVKTQDGLYIEIYKSDEAGQSPLVQKIQMNDLRDGFFNFNGEASNLVLDDINGDSRLEILAPSFDSDLVAHLNIYQYNQGSGLFERVIQ